MTFALQIAVCVVLVLAGLTVAATGWRALRGTLPRNRFFGVRTPATLRDDEAFVVGNRVAAMPTIVGGAIWVIIGAIHPTIADPTTQLIVLLVGLFGPTLLITIGGVLGHRAAAALPEPAPSGGCGGCPGGCCGG